MWTNLYTNSDKKSIYASIMIIISLIVVFFITKDLYYANLEKNSNLENLNAQSINLKDQLDGLNKIKSDLSSSVKMQKIMSQYGWDFREDTIINNIFNKSNWINISDISIDKWEKLPNWLALANVSLNFQSKSIEDLNNYYSYLTSENSNIRFIIKNTSFPFSNLKSTSAFPVSINLWMYYFQKNN